MATTTSSTFNPTALTSDGNSLGRRGGALYDASGLKDYMAPSTGGQNSTHRQLTYHESLGKIGTAGPETEQSVETALTTYPSLANSGSSLGTTVPSTANTGTSAVTSSGSQGELNRIVNNWARDYQVNSDDGISRTPQSRSAAKSANTTRLSRAARGKINRENFESKLNLMRSTNGFARSTILSNAGSTLDPAVRDKIRQVADTTVARQMQSSARNKTITFSGMYKMNVTNEQQEDLADARYLYLCERSEQASADKQGISFSENEDGRGDKESVVSSQAGWTIRNRRVRRKPRRTISSGAQTSSLISC